MDSEITLLNRINKKYNLLRVMRLRSNQKYFQDIKQIESDIEHLWVQIRRVRVSKIPDWRIS